MPALQKRSKMLTFVTETPHEEYDQVVFQQRGPVVNIVGTKTDDLGQDKPAFTQKANFGTDVNLDEARISSNNYVLVIDIPREGYTRDDIDSMFSDQSVDTSVRSDEGDTDGSDSDSGSVNEKTQYTVTYLNDDDEETDVVIMEHSIDAATEMFLNSTNDSVTEDDIVEIVETNEIGDDSDFISVDDMDDDEDGGEDDDDDDDDDLAGDSGKIEG